ncbi:MAG TPA: 2-ketoglutarate ferredoxin oxidoreductase subunit delta [Clostridiales bacterium]|nr:2-ketoglutarate ferredoxin oxidoreductase subunit delta [Clostridiales bacterium]
MWKVEVNEKLCKRCGICSTFCPVKVFTCEIDGLPVYTYQEKCTGCNLCVLRCPDIALTLTGGKEQ